MINAGEDVEKRELSYTVGDLQCFFLKKNKTKKTNINLEVICKDMPWTQVSGLPDQNHSTVLW